MPKKLLTVLLVLALVVGILVYFAEDIFAKFEEN